MGWNFRETQYLLSLDPGTQRLGVAATTPTTLLCGTLWQPAAGAPCPMLDLWTRFTALTLAKPPLAVAFEDYEWQGSARTTKNAPLLWQLIGAIRAWCHHTGIPAVPIHPNRLKADLIGRGQPHTKEALCWVVEQRFGPITQPAGYHVSDAAAAGLWAWDRRVWEKTLRRAIS